MCLWMPKYKKSDITYADSLSCKAFSTLQRTQRIRRDLQLIIIVWSSDRSHTKDYDKWNEEKESNAAIRDETITHWINFK